MEVQMLLCLMMNDYNPRTLVGFFSLFTLEMLQQFSMTEERTINGVYIRTRNIIYA